MLLRLPLRNAWLLVFHLAVTLVFVLLSFLLTGTALAESFIVFGAIYLILFRRLDYADTLVVFLVPWLIAMSASLLPLSVYAVPIHAGTYRLIVFAACTSLIAAGARPIASERSSRISWIAASTSKFSPRLVLMGADFAFWGITILNVVIAGYVPIVREVTTGVSGYLSFGVHGLYGFYLAFANAFGICCLIIYLRTRKRIYLVRYCAIVVVFLAFVTRQNLISLVIESAIVYTVTRGKMRWKHIAVLVLVGLVGFSAIGSARSGNIKKIAGIKNHYLWVPTPAIWLYSYCYFNLANLDDMMLNSNAPYYNGSSVASLIPSFVRPKYDMGAYLLVPDFNATSYMFPLYEDGGFVGTIIFTFLFLRLSGLLSRSMHERVSVFNVGSFAVLYFCAAFSFFVNFWFYLPIIFQIVFFKVLSKPVERLIDLESRRRALDGEAAAQDGIVYVR